MIVQARAEETRLRILQAAETSFAQHGYDATGIAEICRRAGLSKGAFYHHFSSKQAVFVELLNRWLTGLDEQLTTAQAAATTAPDRLQAMAASAGRLFQMTDGHMPIFLEFWSKAARDPAVREAASAPYQRYRDFFADVVQAGAAEGSLKPINPQVTAQVIVSLSVGLLLQSLFDPHGADWAEVAQSGIRLILDGARKEP